MQYVIDQLNAAGTITPLVYALVLLGGIASALSPCFVPVLTMFGGYVGGYAKDSGKQPAGMAAAFTAGQALVLAVVGVVAVLVGKSALTIFTGYELDRYIPALIGIVMGLQLLGVLRLRFPAIGTLRAKRPRTLWRAFGLGLPFGLVITPCTIPVFIMVVTYVALQANVLHGAFLMVAYALGRGIILGVVAFSAGTIKAIKGRKLVHSIERVSGAIILAASIYLLFFYNLIPLPMPTLPGTPGM